ncbi:hypothetical protein [Arthrobacter sp. NPDC057013]|uniref:hypothetical protein n=1 Tax=Arthrobacter sp. NPDC057013 TaxID=3345999 RepID=UPI0036365CDD
MKNKLQQIKKQILTLNKADIPMIQIQVTELIDYVRDLDVQIDYEVNELNKAFTNKLVRTKSRLIADLEDIKAYLNRYYSRGVKRDLHGAEQLIKQLTKADINTDSKLNLSEGYVKKKMILDMFPEGLSSKELKKRLRELEEAETVPTMKKAGGQRGSRWK